MGKKRHKKKPIRKTAKATQKPDGVASTPANQQPRFTVAMATYNRAQWLPSAVESVLTQSFTDFEYVIVDDGSTDNTSEIIRSYDDPRIRYFQKPLNEGRPATRNRVVAEAKGAYILWMADDDRLAPEILSRYHRLLVDDPSVDVVYGNLAVFSEEPDQVESAYEPVDWSTRALEFVGSKLSGSVLPDPGTATRLSLIKQEDGPYDLEFLRAQDYELWSRIAHKIKVKKLDEIIYFYRQHAGSASFGDFVDTTFESKIIRAHRARHPGTILAPQFDWQYTSHATARLNLLIATHLNEYRDGYNALRFACALPQWHCEPLVLKQVVMALTIQGRLDEAERVVKRALSEVPKLSQIFGEWLATIGRLRSFADMTCASLEAGLQPAQFEELQTLVKQWGWTYDLARVFAHLNQYAGDLKKASLAFCYAARLNLSDVECATALQSIAPSVQLSRGKIDLSNMRARILEQHVELGAVDVFENKGVSGKISVLDLHHGEPDTIIDALIHQPEGTYEIIGFYREAHADPRVVSCGEPTDGSAPLAVLSKAASGNWIVVADEKFDVYPHWATSILGANQASSYDVQFCAQHEPDPDDEEGLLTLRSMIPIRLVYGGHGVPTHRFAVSRDGMATFLKDTVSDVPSSSAAFRLHYAAYWLANQSGLHHVGATQFHAGFNPNYELEHLLEFFRKHHKHVLFDREIRRAQNRILDIHRRNFQDSGRVHVAILPGQDDASTLAQIRSLYAHTYAPAKAILVCNTPSETSLSAFRNAKSVYGELGAVINHRCVSHTKLINQAFTRMGAECMVLLDPNVKLAPHWLSYLLWFANQYQDLGVLSVQIEDAKALDMRCCLVTREAINRVGGLALQRPLSEAISDFLARVKASGLRVEQTSAPSLGFESLDESTPLFDQHHLQLSTQVSQEEALFCEYVPEPGFLPDTQPVQILDSKSRRMLAYPPWDEPTQMSALLGVLSELNGWSIYLRCPNLEAEAHRLRLLEMVDVRSSAALADCDIQLVDTIIAPDREAGLFTAVDLVYADETWAQSQIALKRAFDCGTPVACSKRELFAAAKALTSAVECE